MKNVTKMLMRLMMIISLSIVLFQEVAWSENVGTVGTGTTAINYPFYAWYYQGRTQYLYTAAQMTGAGLCAGQFTKLAFYHSSSSASTWLNPLYIKFKATTNTALPTGAFEEGGFTTVWTGNYTIPSTGWKTTTLATPWTWDGTSNLIIEVCFTNNDWFTTNYCYHTGTTASTMRYWYSDSGNGCTATGPNSANYVANIQLTTPNGTLSGTVKSTVTGNPPIIGATVAGGGNSTTTGGGGAYSMSVNSCTQSYTASFTGYIPSTLNGTVTPGGTGSLNFFLTPIPAYVEGVITNCSNGAKILGAKISVSTSPVTIDYSVNHPTYGNGWYQVSVFPGGTYNVTFSKAGFRDTTVTGVVLTPNVHTVINMCMTEAWNKPSTPFTAALNGGQTAVNLNWGVPVGEYELIYDDGIQEYSTVWAQAGNMWATKFTALNYPVKVLRGSVNIGPASDYASGTLPSALKPFTVQVYDATGTGGMPGAALGSPVTVQPTTFGWNTFTIGSLNIASGNYYLVMTQGGAPPTAARIGVDNTNSQMRSFSKWVTGSGPWLPADGNFLIRLVVQGIGGPIKSPDVITGYQVWRLLQGQQGNQGLWTSIWAGSGTTTVDNSWPSLVCGGYMWAVKAQYSGNHWSDPTFSNALGKCWTSAVTVQVNLSCSAIAQNGTVVKLTGQPVTTDSIYTATTDATGKVVFPHVWNGTYTLTAARMGFTTATMTVTIMNDQTINLNVLQIKVPVSNVYVDRKSLHAKWNWPKGTDFYINEDFSSGQFSTNGWTTAAWAISSSVGNPAPSAQLYWTPTYMNYSLPLMSRPITGWGVTPWTLNWDVYLDNYSASSSEYLDVQVGVGVSPSTWTTIKTYVNSGSIAWTTETYDLSAYTNQTICIRFLARGYYTFYINNWNVDNVVISPSFPDPKPCVLGFNIYLNTALDGVSTDTNYVIPGGHVVYNGVYNTCVKAIYGSGYSALGPTSCYQFTSKFLWPPTNLQVQAVECVAYLTWHKPEMTSKTHVPAFKGFIENTPPSLGLAPYNAAMKPIENEEVPNAPTGAIAFAAEAANFGTIGYFDVNNLPGYTSIISDPASQFTSCLIYPLGNTSWAYGGGYNETDLFKYDRATGVRTSQGSIGHYFNGMTIAPGTNVIYGNDASGNALYTVDPTAPSATMVGSYGGSVYLMIGLACDYNNNLWGYDIGNDYFYSINKATGTATGVGPIGFNANYAQTMFFDGATGNVVMGAFNASTYYGQIRVVDVATGNSTVISQAYYYEITAATVPITNPTEPAGLLGYKIYRDGMDLAHYLDYVSGKDTTWYYDYTVQPGLHTYYVSAWYDLTPYGYPGQHDESLLEGPKSVNMVCGIDLPFFEPWDQFSWTYHNWVHNGNWTLNSSIGNPAPCADFSWLPPAVNYNQWIETPTLNAGPYTCAKIYLDFDYKLVDRNQTGKEYLTIEEYVGGAYKKITEFTNNGNVAWKASHNELKTTIGKAFKVRFRAHGVNTQDILHWYVDNIHVYAVCTRPTALVGAISHNNVTLNWTAPNCQSWCPQDWVYDDDSWENGLSINPGYTISLGNYFPIDPSVSGFLQSFDNWFLLYGSSSAQSTTLTVYKPDGTVLGNSAPFVNNDGWVNVPVPDIAFSGPFYAMIDYTTSGGILNYLLMDEDGPLVTGNGLASGLYNGAFGDAYTLFGTNPANFCQRGHGLVECKKSDFVFDSGSLPKYTNVTKIQGAAVQSGKPAGVSQDVLPPVHFTPKSASTALLGYNVYRTDSTATPPFSKLNNAYITATTYTDVIPLYGWGHYKYYVTSNFKDTVQGTFLCESPGSDTVNIQFPAVGISEVGAGQIMVYPNPATDNVNIKSDYVINAIDVMNYVGQTVYKNTNVADKATKFSVASLQSGVYFVRVNTEQGTRTVKVTVTH